jgi:hypothetical protein
MLCAALAATGRPADMLSPIPASKRRSIMFMCFRVSDVALARASPQ